MSLLHISRAGTSGLSVYRILRRAGDDYRWIIGDGFEAYNAANLDSYDIPLTDDGGDVYSADVDFTGAAGRYIGKDYIRSGATPAPDDYPLPGEEVYDWTGTGLSGDVHYATIADVKLELGKDSADIWADLENTLSGVDISAVQDDALTLADRWINRELREAGVLIPLMTNGNSDDYSYSLGQINDAARKYAAGTLLNKREGQSRTAGQKTSGDVLKEQAEEIMDELVEAGAPGLTTATVGDLDLNTVSVVAVGATQDARGCPIPTGTCCPGVYDARAVRRYGWW